MSEEYVFIDNAVLKNPLEQQVPQSTIAIINFVEEADLTFDQHTVEVF